MYPGSVHINGSDLVSDIVTRDYRTADVLSRYSIDYTVHSDGTLQQACREKGIDIDEVQSALQNAVRHTSASASLPFSKWKIDFLIDYIENVHHEYVKEKLPVIKSCIEKLIQADPVVVLEIRKLEQAFDDIHDAVLPKLINEETSVFPYFKQITSAWNKKESYGALLVKTLRKPYEKILVQEHKRLLDLVENLRKITCNYAFVSGASIGYNILMQHLKEFDNDTQQHIFLEDKILFPRVMTIEKELLSLSFSL